MEAMKENIPRHEQIAGWIRDEISSGRFGIDEKIPSENELSTKFDVSRVTVRRALQTLENEQKIYRCQGLGSFVKGKKPVQQMLAMNDFMEDMKQNGLEGTSIVIQNTIEAATPIVAQHLKIEPGTKVFRLDRLRLANGKPIALDYTWLPAFYGQLIVDYDLEKRTIFDILENEYDIEITSGCYYLQAETASESQAVHLNIPENAALFRLDRISYTLHEKPVYYQRRFYRNDKFVYRMRVERTKDASDNPTAMPLSEIKAEFL